MLQLLRRRRHFDAINKFHLLSHVLSLSVSLSLARSLPLFSNADALGDFDAPLLPPEAKPSKEKAAAAESERKSADAPSATMTTTTTATTTATKTTTAATKAGGLGALPPRKKKDKAPGGAKTTTALAGGSKGKGTEGASGFDFGAALASSGGGGSSSSSSREKKTAAAAAGTSTSAAAAEPDDAAAMLSALMSQLGGSLGGEGGNIGDAKGSDGKEATLTALAEQLSAAAAAAGKSENDDGEDDDEPLPEDLLSRLEATLDRLQAAGAEAAGGDGNEDDIGGAAEGAGSGTDEAALSGFAAIIMRQMLAKEVMYTPMKEIGEKYPDWLSLNASKLSDEETTRYRAQQACVSKIVAHYESDSDDFDALFALLQEMQAQGQPPQELVDELAPGLTFGEDGMPNLLGGGGGGSGGGRGLAAGLAGLGAGAAGGPDACCLM